MHSRQQYLQSLRDEYLKVGLKEKKKLLDEAQKRTGFNRKYLIRKLSPKALYGHRARRARKQQYEGRVIDALVQVWELFDYPCAQRLKPLLETELKRLISLGIITCSQTIFQKLTIISSATIDRKLAHERTERQLKRYRYPRIHPLLYQKIPVKVADEWDREQLGNLQLDYVTHCGSSASGQFVYTLSAADIGSGWWDGEAIMGRSQQVTNQGLIAIQKRLPFRIREIHPDNDSGMINDLIFRYCQLENIAFSRSRPNKKNDNAWVEQRNWTHIRKTVGYLRYDTHGELHTMNKLYRCVSLYKNFFQPTMKLIEKERIGGKVKRRYDRPRTPYQRVLDSKQINTRKLKRLMHVYQSLNPAHLKRDIEHYRNELYAIYQQKMKAMTVIPMKKQSPRPVTNYMMYQKPLRLPS